MSAHNTAGPYSVVNGKLLRDTATARVDVSAIEARNSLNKAFLRLEAIERYVDNVGYSKASVACMARGAADELKSGVPS